jgi:hypothetical protein
LKEQESRFAKQAIIRLQDHPHIVLMGSEFSELHSSQRLSITSFNIQVEGEDKRLHHHFVATLLNDVFGIQARSGCSCAGPYGFKLLNIPNADVSRYKDFVANQGLHGVKLGWVRVNFNYFIPQDEFDFICSAIEMIAQHGWKLLPLYSFCLKSGMWEFHSRKYNRLQSVRSLKEFHLLSNGTCTWLELKAGQHGNVLGEAKSLFNNALAMVKDPSFQVKDFQLEGEGFPEEYQDMRFFVLPSEMLLRLQSSAC